MRIKFLRILNRCVEASLPWIAALRPLIAVHASNRMGNILPKVQQALDLDRHLFDMARLLTSGPAKATNGIVLRTEFGVGASLLLIHYKIALLTRFNGTSCQLRLQ